MELSKEEIKRYSRQIQIPEFGLAGQNKLKNAAVLVIGCGGLGSPVLLYLAAAGVGKLGLIDDDNIEQSNLNRQVLYSEAGIGKSKVEEADKRIDGLNKNVIIEKYSTRITRFNALEIIEKYDLVIDGSDNFPTRYLVNDACLLRNKPLVYGAIYRFEGQVSVFNFNGGPNYRDLFPNPPSEEMAPNCATAGVLGIMAGIIGTLQATEAIKIITGIGKSLGGKLLIVDALEMDFHKISILKKENSEPITQLIDYESFCNSSSKVKSISYREIESLGVGLQIIDVRESFEHELENIGGKNIPISEIEDNLDQIEKEVPVLLYCQSGLRSRQVIRLLSEKYGFDNLINLEGGMNAVFL